MPVTLDSTIDRIVDDITLRTPMVRGIGQALDQLTPKLEKALG